MHLWTVERQKRQPCSEPSGHKMNMQWSTVASTRTPPVSASASAGGGVASRSPQAATQSRGMVNVSPGRTMARRRVSSPARYCARPRLEPHASRRRRKASRDAVTTRNGSSTGMTVLYMRNTALNTVRIKRTNLAGLPCGSGGRRHKNGSRVCLFLMVCNDANMPLINDSCNGTLASLNAARQYESKFPLSCNCANRWSNVSLVRAPLRRPRPAAPPLLPSPLPPSHL